MDATRGVAAAFVEHAPDDPVGFEGHHFLLLYVCLLGIGILDRSVSAVWRAAGAFYNFILGRSRYCSSPCFRPTVLFGVYDTSDVFACSGYDTNCTDYDCDVFSDILTDFEFSESAEADSARVKHRRPCTRKWRSHLVIEVLFWQ